MELQRIFEKYISCKMSSVLSYTGLLDSPRENTLSFLSDEKFLPQLNCNDNIVAVLVDENLSSAKINAEIISVKNPKALFFEIHNEWCATMQKGTQTSIASDARIAPSASISDVGVEIGSQVVIMPGAVILDGVSVGAGSVIGPGTVVGTDGFHCFDDLQGRKKKVLHDGRVIIGENVEIGANVSIDRGLMGRDTIIGSHTKIDNLVHVAHRVHIGEACLLVAGSVISGSVTLGKGVWVGPGVVISNRITIGDEARLLIGAVVVRNVKPGASVSGNFAMDHKQRVAIMALERSAFLDKVNLEREGK